MSKELLIAVREQFQSLLDNYHVPDVAMATFKGAMMQLSGIIETPEAPPVVALHPVTSTDAVVQGVIVGLSGALSDIMAGINAMPAPPTVEQIAEAVSTHTQPAATAAS